MIKRLSWLGRLWFKVRTRPVWILARSSAELRRFVLRVRLWNARRNVRKALRLIKRQMDRVGMPRTQRRAFWRELAEDRLQYLENFWRG